MIAPPRLRDGQTIGVVAPAGPIAADKLAGGLARLGDRFAIRLAPSLAPDATRDPAVPSYLAASDDQRVDELHAMLRDPDVRAIVLARGGYGITRILDRLDADLLRADPKPIVGFSDATALLAWAHRAGVRGIHGPMIGQLGTLDDADVASLVAVLTQPTPRGARPWALTAPARVAAQVIEAPLVVANLTLTSMLVGTAWPVPLAGALALFEEVGERAYEVDRYATQLRMTGALADTRALVFGDFTKCDDHAAVLDDRFADRAFARGAPVGHGERNEALPFGARATLAFDGAGGATLSIDEPAVS